MSKSPQPLRFENAAAFLRSDAADPPVTVIREVRVRPGHERVFEDLMAGLMTEGGRQPGHLGSTVVRPQLAGHAYRFIYKFEHRSQLETWHNSARRAELAEPIATLVESDRFDQYPGLETWFNIPLSPSGELPPKWKTTLVSWLAIYPLVVAGSYVMKALSFTAPMPVQAFVLTVVVVPLVAYLFAPWLGRRLHGWLHANPHSPTAQLTPGNTVKEPAP